MTESRARTWEPDPTLPGYVTDGGLETDLVFHHGVQLAHFAAFPLLVDPKGRELLVDYYSAYAEIAAAAGAGLILETPTWRASHDWGARLGVGDEGLVGVNADAVHLLAELGARYADEVPEVVVAGMVGPRGDGYVVGEVMDPWEARDYHLPQARALATAGADLVTSLTLGTVSEAVGVALAAGEVGLPVSVGFTVETDGRLPDGTPLRAAIEAVDDVAPPDARGRRPRGRRSLARADRRHAGQRLRAQPRRARHGPGARRGGSGRARRWAGRARLVAPRAAGRRWLLRYRRAPRRGDVGSRAAGIDPPGVSRVATSRRTGVRLGSSTGEASDSTRPQA